MLAFAKLEAAGNGYVAVDGRGPEHAQRDWPALARAMGDAHFGIGSDGLLVVQRSERAPVRMRVFNSDGSEAEMSGNGIRLFAKFVLDRGIARADSDGLVVETRGGLRRLWPRFDASGAVCGARVSMGEPRFAPSDLGLVAKQARGLSRLVDFPLDAAGRRLQLTCLSLGNPHAVLLLDEPVDEFPLAQVGPAVERHAWFPRRINFEIVNVLARDRVRARIHERGEGETLASGTGSTASVVAASLHGLLEESVCVELPGGELTVEWPGEGEAFLEGPSVECFTGDWPDGA